MSAVEADSQAMRAHARRLGSVEPELAAAARDLRAALADGSAAAGHDHVAAGLDAFGAYWPVQLDALAGAAPVIERELDASAQAYDESDAAAARSLSRVLAAFPPSLGGVPASGATAGSGRPDEPSVGPADGPADGPARLRAALGGA